MTWGELKRQFDAAGVRDTDEIEYLEVMPFVCVGTVMRETGEERVVVVEWES